MDRSVLRNPLPPGSRYELLVRIASGGMASVYLGRVKGPGGFVKIRAIKRAHPHLLEDRAFRERLEEEARLSALIDHRHVVAMQDVESIEDELLLVMDYVEGGSLSELRKALQAEGQRLSLPVALRIVLDAAAGLGAAHVLAGPDGEPLGLVHRDVSPQNILVGTDGASRIADFGIAKCMSAPTPTATQTGTLKGKIGYMAPEYVKGRGIDARADVFALAIVLWEAAAARPLFAGDNDFERLQNVCMQPAPPLSEVSEEATPALDRVVARALEKSPAARFASMAAFARALEEAAVEIADRREVGALVHRLLGRQVERRRELVNEAQERRPAANPAPSEDEEETIERTAIVTASEELPPRRHTTRLVVVAGTAAVVGALVLASQLRGDEAPPSSADAAPPPTPPPSAAEIAPAPSAALDDRAPDDVASPSAPSAQARSVDAESVDAESVDAESIEAPSVQPAPAARPLRTHRPSRPEPPPKSSRPDPNPYE